MNDLKIWENPEFGTLRVIEQDGEPWMVGKDVAQALGYAKPENAIATHVDDEDKTSTLIQGSGSNYKSKTIIINESGLYSLVLSSKLPSAKRFRRWVTGEVLPSIRKDGGYIKTAPGMTDADIMAKAILLAQKTIDDQRKQLDKLTPAAEYAQNFLLASGGRLASSIAKEYGMSAVKFNKLLKSLGIQYRQGGQWLLYQKYTGKGYTETRVNLIPHNDGLTHQHPETLWTPKGCAFLHKKLKDAGFVPMKGESN